jgi:hypothetical protein
MKYKCFLCGKPKARKTCKLTLSQPLRHSQGLWSLQALNWLVIGHSQVLSHGCESVVEAVRVLYTLAASLGYPTITMGTLMAFISTLMASTGIFMNSTTLTRPTLILMSLCKHSHSSARVSEGFGSWSIPLTNGSGSGRVDPDQDSDTDRNKRTNVPISKLRIRNQNVLMCSRT